MTHPNSCVTVGDDRHTVVTRDTSTNLYQQKARTHSESKHTSNPKLTYFNNNQHNERTIDRREH